MLMKKALLIALTLGLIFAWTVPVMAIDWIAVGGFTVKNMYYKNVDFRNPTLLGGVPGSNRFLGTITSIPAAPVPIIVSGPAMVLDGLPAWGGNADPAWNDDSWFMQMRGNIFIVARASADLQGVFGIEVNSTRFGEPDPAAPPAGFPANGGYAGRWNADAVAIQVKSMFIDFKVPSLPVRLKAGIQPYMLRPAAFLYADAPGLTGNVKILAGDYAFNINPFWAIVSHGFYSEAWALGGSTLIPTDWTTSDDGNFFGVDFNAVIGEIKPGVFFAMQRQGQLYNSAGTNEGNRNLWWLGAYADAKFGGLGLNLDFIYNGGYDQWENGTINVTDVADVIPLNISTSRTYSVRHEGLLFRGVASYTVNKFTFGVGGLYGTGDDLDTLDKNEAFKVPYRSEAAKFNDDFVVLTGDFGLRQPYGTQNVGGLYKAWSSPGQGVWYVRGFADYAVTDWLKLKVNGGYIGDTCQGHANEAFAIRGGDEFGTDQDDDQSVGWEFDAGVQISIYKNLYLDSAFGYLVAGKALAGQIYGYRAQDPWVWASTLTYQF
jgi:hypothetical protein